MSNIVLIGMPGCGKSTVGVILAKTLGIGFVDTDLIIQQRENRLLQNIIDTDGIDYFLECESNAIQSIECENSVIATGAIVTKGCGNGCILAGNPAKIVKENITWDY